MQSVLFEAQPSATSQIFAQFVLFDNVCVCVAKTTVLLFIKIQSAL